MSNATRYFENIFVSTAPLVLISRVYLRYHSLAQIAAGSTIGLLLALTFYYAVGRKLVDRKKTHTFWDKIITDLEKEPTVIDEVIETFSFTQSHRT